MFCGDTGISRECSLRAPLPTQTSSAQRPMWRLHWQKSIAATASRATPSRLTARATRTSSDRTVPLCKRTDISSSSSEDDAKLELKLDRLRYTTVHKKKMAIGLWDVWNKDFFHKLKTAKMEAYQRWDCSLLHSPARNDWRWLNGISAECLWSQRDIIKRDKTLNSAPWIFTFRCMDFSDWNRIGKITVR